MYVIVGLGNPDKKYEHTRHNIGFDVIDALADKYNISVTAGAAFFADTDTPRLERNIIKNNNHFLIRIRKKGSAGGHNGIKSIIAMTGTQGFSRIKVGVGEKPQGWDLADHVLGRFSSEDRAKVEEAIGHAMDAAVLMMQGETDKAMNTYN